jgi:RNA polymerase sigma factor (sigma-70 family)
MTMPRQPETRAPAQTPDLLATMHRRWKEDCVRDGFWPAARSFAGRIREFLWESMPAQRRRRYGDAEYDWDHRVNTTSATVGWRERLLGQFHSGYQPTEPALFKEMMSSLKINFQEFTFIDIGSGKGRVLLMAADYPFRRIVGVELFPALHRVAQENLDTYASDSQRCFALEAVCGDARTFIFPREPLLLYLFNSLPEAALIESEDRTSLYEGLSQLSERDRLVLGYRFLLGLSEAETAAALDTRPGTVKSRTSRALSHLRDALGEIV